jgi:hypothetical protein
MNLDILTPKFNMSVNSTEFRSRLK